MRVFLSSTKADLEEERETVYARLSRSHEIVRMEDFGSRGEDTLLTCLEEICRCDAAVVIVGHRYGSIATNLGLSYTEAEYERSQECGVDVLAYVKEGFDGAYEHADHPLRLKDFRDALEEAHTVHRPYFSSPEELAERAETDLSNLAARRTRRLRFRNPRRAVRDPNQYSVGTLRRTRLQMKPFRVALVDTAVLDTTDYSTVGTRRVRSKVLEVTAAIDDAGANVFIFNEIPSRQSDSHAIVEERVRETLVATDAIVCVVKGTQDAQNVTKFANAAERLVVWLPERVGQLASVPEAFQRTYTTQELNDCSLAKKIIDELYERINMHLYINLGDAP